MSQASAEIVIAAPIEHVFEVIADYERYPEFLPEMKAVRVDSKVDDVAIVTFELELIMRLSYTLRLVAERPRRLRWSLERAKMMTENDGGWELSSTPEGHTKAIYGLELKLKGLVPRSVSTRLAGQTLPQTLQRFKTRAESLWRG